MEGMEGSVDSGSVDTGVELDTPGSEESEVEESEETEDSDEEESEGKPRRKAARKKAAKKSKEDDTGDDDEEDEEDDDEEEESEKPRRKAAGKKAAKEATEKPNKTSQEGMRRYKVKIDGQEQEVSEEELLAGYQSRAASHRAFQEAAGLRKKLAGFLQNIKTNKGAALEQFLKSPELGLDFKEIATDYLAQQIERESMTDEQRELMDLRRKLELRERAEQEAQERQQQQELAQRRHQTAQQLQKDVLEAFESEGVKANHFTYRRAIFYLKEGLRRGYKLTADAAVRMVKDDYQRELADLTSSLDLDGLEKLVGSERLAELGKRRVAKLRAQKEAEVQDDDPEGDEDVEAKPRPRRRRRSREPEEPQTYADIVREMRRDAVRGR